MNKYTIIGITLCLALAFVSTQPTRQDQSCETQYSSWYYSGQQCMQCYSYSSDSSDICHQCSGDKCGSCHLNGGVSSKKINVRNNNGEIVETEINYCRQCGTDANIADCCWMDNSQKIKLNTNIDNDTLEVQELTYGTSSYTTLGFHATKCLTPGQEYTDFSGAKKTASTDDIKLYGSVCYTIANCKKIGDYGRCTTCQDGYYLHSDLSCKPCDPHPWITAASELANPVINLVTKTTAANGRCVKCNGPSQCSECGIYEDGGKYYGSYLATNLGRDFHDLNIAKNPSFCRSCSENCQCTDATDLCTSCIDGTGVEAGTVGGYYYHPHEMMCKPCNTIDALCDQCKWVPELDKAICVGCQQRTDAAGSTAFQGYNKPAKTFNSDSSYNVLEFPKTYYIRGDTEDHTVKAVADSQVKCVPCNKVYQQTIGKEYKIQWEKKTDTEYVIKETSVEDVKIDGQDENRIRYFDHDTTETITFDQTSTAYTAGGCADCALKFVEASIPSSTSEDRTYSTSDKPIERLWYVTCDQCHNGFAEVEYGNFNYWSNVEALKTTKGETGTRRYSIQSYKKCHTCQYLINLHDQKLKSTSVVSELKDDNRYKAVTRCNKLSVDSTLKSFFNYEITQCGSKNIENYLAGDGALDTSDQSSADRGTGYFNAKQDGKAITITDRADVTNYFTDANNKLGKFRVNVNQNGDSKYKNMQNLCVSNKNNCKQIIDISQDTNSPYSNEASFSPLTSPRCSDCFANYVLTQDKTCVYCPSTYGVKGTLTQNNLIDEGCMQCHRETITTTETTKQHSDKIRCGKCYNEYNQISQVKRSQRTQHTTYQVGYDRKNYFYDTTDKKCFECNLGCKKCLNVNKRCDSVQKYWRFNENKGTDNTTFERCQVDYCISCTAHMNQCDKCESGYTVIKLFSKEENTFRYECERCDIGCLACEADTLKETEDYNTSIYNRKKCTICDTAGYYMDENNMCIQKRANCINWEHKGGACLQCAHGYRLQEGWCYKCINGFSGLLSNGYWDCPAKCDSETGITATSSNVRNAEALKANAELTSQKNPSTDPETPDETQQRILQLLDDFQPQKQQL